MNRGAVRSVIAIAAVVGLATPAAAATDTDVKRAIVEVVLENLGVDASTEFIDAIVSELGTADLDAGLVARVRDLLDANSDPRAAIEGQTDADGDGVPDEGAALEAPDEEEEHNDESDDDGSESSSESEADESDDEVNDEEEYDEEESEEEESEEEEYDDD